MSHEAVAWAYRQRAGSAYAKAVLVALADHANGDGYCYPGQVSIAERTEMTDRAVRTQLVKLEDLGLIAREARMRTEGRGRSSDGYWLVGLTGDQPEAASGNSARPTGSWRTTNRKLAHDQPEAGSGGRTVREPPENRQAVMCTVDDSFAAFWAAYPARDGKKLAKAKAHQQWRKLTAPKRREAITAVAHYAAACGQGLTRAKDAHRWLRDHAFADWQTPAVPETNGNVRDLRRSPGVELAYGFDALADELERQHR